MLKLNSSIKLQELAVVIGAEIKTKVDCSVDLDSIYISSIAAIDVATEQDLTFLANPLYSKYLATTKAKAVITTPKYAAQCPGISLVSSNPRLVLAKLLNLCVPVANPKIDSNSIIGNNVKLGTNVTIAPGVIIGDNCIIGNGTTLKANVVLYPNTVIGENCVIHSNTVIGADGFGYAQDDSGDWVKIPHLGRVILEDRVEIGSNTCVDRGCIGDTLLKTGVIVDNLVQIAHNVVIGEHTAIAGCVGIAGSTVIGSNCLIGGAVNIAGHLVITDNVHITGATMVTKSLLKPGVYSSGVPANHNSIWRKNIARFNCLDQTIKDLIAKIKHLEDKLIHDNLDK